MILTIPLPLAFIFLIVTAIIYAIAVISIIYEIFSHKTTDKHIETEQKTNKKEMKHYDKQI